MPYLNLDPFTLFTRRALLALVLASPLFGCSEDMNNDEREFQCVDSGDCLNGYVCRPKEESEQKVCTPIASLTDADATPDARDSGGAASDADDTGSDGTFDASDSGDDVDGGQDVCTPDDVGEVCDNLDNDCDGEIDEDLSRACPDTVGVCAEEGRQVCAAGEWGACDVKSTSELCHDEKDNDCDGTTDELDDTTQVQGGESCRGDCECLSASCINGSCRRRIFVTVGTFDGDFEENDVALTAFESADAICQGEADIQGIGGTWKALLSIEGSDAKDRLSISGSGVETMQGGVVAGSRSSFWTATSHQSAIKYSASGGDQSGLGTTRVWTGTMPNGEASGWDCEAWTLDASSYPGADQGLLTAAGEKAWVDDNNFLSGCHHLFRLYCIDGQ